MMSNLSFFDANVLIGRVARPLRTMMSEPEDILAELARHGIREALIGHSHAEERAHEDNAEVLETVRKYPGTRPVFVLPQHSALDIPRPELAMTEMLDARVAAVRIPPSRYNGYTVDPWALGPMWSLLESARMPVLLPGSDLGRYPDAPARGYSAKNLYDIAQTYPQLPLVILRTNFSSLRVLVPLLKECPNLHAEISFFTAHHGVETLVREIGPERVIFGSGMPWGPPGPGVVATTYAAIAPQDKRLIAGDNIRRLIGAIES